MNTSLADNETITILNNILLKINLYGASTILIYGFIGHILNILVLVQHTLRTNSCAWLLLLSSIANLISICVGLITRFLSGLNADLTTSIDWLCKLRSYIVYTTRTMAFWFLVLATLDRWLSSSRNPLHRQRSSLKHSQQYSKFIGFIYLFMYVHMFYCYEANLINTPIKCYDKTLECRYVTDLIYGLITTLLPLICMIIFSLLTICNVRKIQTRLQPHYISHADLHSDTNIHISTRIPSQTRLKKKIDRHLFFMLAIQILFLTLLTFPQAIQKLHSTFTIRFGKNAWELAVDNFIYGVLILFTYVACGSSFYISILCGGKVFRDAFFNIPKFVCRC